MNKKNFSIIVSVALDIVLVVLIVSINFITWNAISKLENRVDTLELAHNVIDSNPKKVISKTIPADELTDDYVKELATFYSNSVYRLLDVKVNSVDYSLNILRTDIGPILLEGDQAVLVRDGDLVSVVGKFHINSESKVSFRKAELYEVKFNDTILSTFDIDISNTYYNLEGNT